MTKKKNKVQACNGSFPHLEMGPGTASNRRKLDGKARGVELPWQDASAGFRVVLDTLSHSDDPRFLLGTLSELLTAPRRILMGDRLAAGAVLRHKHHRGENKESVSADKYCHPIALFIFDYSVSQGNRKCKRKECLYFGRAGLVKSF